MAPSEERLAVLEVEVRTVKVVTAETKEDVKELLRWRDEERGAREAERIFRQKQDELMSTRVKVAGVVLTVLTLVVNVLFRLV